MFLVHVFQAERNKFDYNIEDLFMTYGGSQHGAQQSFCILLCLYLRVLTFLKMLKFIRKNFGYIYHNQ